MTAARASTARVHTMHGFTFRPLATPALGTHELALWQVVAPPGAQSPPRTMSREEVLVVQDGRLVATVADERHELSAGDALTVPADATFALANPFDEPAQALACTSAGMQATVGGRTMSPPWAA
ncbi:cupin domain-containing protein [Cellulomonas sp. NPDC055163]